jgi:hypothetical protein
MVVLGTWWLLVPLLVLGWCWLVVQTVCGVCDGPMKSLTYHCCWVLQWVLPGREHLVAELQVVLGGRCCVALGPGQPVLPYDLALLLLVVLRWRCLRWLFMATYMLGCEVCCADV